MRAQLLCLGTVLACAPQQPPPAAPSRTEQTSAPREQSIAPAARARPTWIGVLFQVDSTRVMRVIDDAPAAAAGLRAADRVAAVDGVAVSNASDVIAIVNRRAPGDSVELLVERDGAMSTIRVPVAERPDLLEMQRSRLLDKPAPALALSTLAGTPLSLADLQGKVVVLDFWATWCGPCVAAQPHLSAWHQRLGPKGVAIVGITEEDADAVRPYVEKHAVSYTIALDPAADAWRAYLVQAIPTTVIIDKAGTVRHVIAGMGEPARVEAAIELLLRAR